MTFRYPKELPCPLQFPSVPAVLPRQDLPGFGRMTHSTAFRPEGRRYIRVDVRPPDPGLAPVMSLAF